MMPLPLHIMTYYLKESNPMILQITSLLDL